LSTRSRGTAGRRSDPGASPRAKEILLRPSKPYHDYTDYGREPSGLLRLDIIVEAIERHRRAAGLERLHVLDVGCGCGNISLPLGSLGHEVVGVDLDEESVRIAAARNPFPDRVRFLAKRAEELNLDRPFDAIVASEVVEHVPEPFVLLANLRRALKPGGIMIVTIPNGSTWEERTRWFLIHTRTGRRIRDALRRTLLTAREDQVQTKSRHAPHLHFWRLEPFVHELERIGLRVGRVENNGAWFKQLHTFLLRFLVRRGSALFHKLDEWDARACRTLPTRRALGWILICEPAPQAAGETV
jgi:SAM-dependent methyltransferase